MCNFIQRQIIHGLRVDGLPPTLGASPFSKAGAKSDKGTTARGFNAPLAHCQMAVARRVDRGHSNWSHWDGAAVVTYRAPAVDALRKKIQPTLIKHWRGASTSVI